MNVQNEVKFPGLVYKLITVLHKDLIKEFGPGCESSGLAFEINIIGIGASLEGRILKAASCLAYSTGMEKGSEECCTLCWALS